VEGVCTSVSCGASPLPRLERRGDDGCTSVRLWSGGSAPLDQPGYCHSNPAFRAIPAMPRIAGQGRPGWCHIRPAIYPVCLIESVDQVGGILLATNLVVEGPPFACSNCRVTEPGAILVTFTTNQAETGPLPVPKSCVDQRGKHAFAKFGNRGELHPKSHRSCTIPEGNHSPAPPPPCIVAQCPRPAAPLLRQGPGAIRLIGGGKSPRPIVCPSVFGNRPFR